MGGSTSEDLSTLCTVIFAHCFGSYFSGISSSSISLSKLTELRETFLELWYMWELLSVRLPLNV